MTMPKTRKEAKSENLKFYFTGKPCIRGHIANRRISDSSCVECLKENLVKHKKTDTFRITINNYYINNITKSKETSKRNALKTKIERPWEVLLKHAKRRSSERGLPFNLNSDWAKANWTGYCALTGLPFLVDTTGISGPKPFSPSIDRIVPSLGYVESNCRFILASVNTFRGIMGDTELLKIAQALVTHNL